MWRDLAPKYGIRTAASVVVLLTTATSFAEQGIADNEAPAYTLHLSEKCEACQAHLIHDKSDLSLSFVLKTSASDPDMSAHVSAIDTGLQYHYSSIPDSEHLYFDTLASRSQELNHVLIANTLTTTDDKGVLSDTTLPDGMPKKRGRALIKLLEQSLQKLLQFNPDALAQLEDNTPVLVVSNPLQTTVTLYSTSTPIVQLAEIITTESEEPIVEWNDSWQPAPATPSETLNADQPSTSWQKTLNVVSVQVISNEKAFQRVIDYLKELAAIVENKKTRSKLLKLALSGELSWKSDTTEATEATEASSVKKSGKTPDTGKTYQLADLHKTVTIDRTHFRAEFRTSPAFIDPTIIDISHVETVYDALAHINEFLQEASYDSYSRYKIIAKNPATYRFWVNPSIREDVFLALQDIDTTLSYELMSDIKFLNDSTQKIFHKIQQQQKLYAATTGNTDNINFNGPELWDQTTSIVRDIRKTVPFNKRGLLRRNILPAKNSESAAQESPTKEAVKIQETSPKKLGDDKPKPDYFKKNISSFAISAAVGGSISAGIHIYDHYQKFNTLPHQYGKKEWKEFSFKMLHDTTRYGLSGVTVQNLVDAGVPPIAAGAAIGTVNSLYDIYFSNKPNNGVLGALANAGATSVASGVGAYFGRTAVSTVPVLGKASYVQGTGSLMGSFIGHMIYERVADYGTSYFQGQSSN